MVKGPLTGIRVVDLGTAHAGNMGSRILGDLGAEMIKIEPPKYGELVRPTGPFCGPPEYLMGSYVVAFCRNRKSVTLDLYTDPGKEALHDLVKISDIIFDNYRLGVLERISADWETVRKINPRIISCSVTGFGSSGPYAGRVSYNDIAEGLTGIWSLCGEKGGNPIKPPISSADLSGGIFATIGMLAALHERERTGKGRRVEVNLLDACMNLLTMPYMAYFLSGKVPVPHGRRNPSIAMLGAFKTRNGYITSAPSWPRVCRVINREELIDDPRFNTIAKRFDNREELNSILEEELQKEDSETWQELFQVEDMAVGPINTLDKALEDPQIIHNKSVITLEHPVYGKIRNIDSPIKIIDAIEGEYTPPPMLGEHNEEILKGILGYSDEKIKRINEEADKHAAELESHVRKIL